nr:MAG TPA: hypothetical protein [Caudoviricetes sp.]
MPLIFGTFMPVINLLLSAFRVIYRHNKRAENTAGKRF